MYDLKLLTDYGVNIQKSLELFGDMDTYNDTIKDFQAELDKKLKLIEEYKASSDMKNYAIHVHSLKSDARYFGFEKLGDLAYDHEMKSKANDIEYVSEHYNELIEEAYRVANIVNEYLGVDAPKHEVAEAPRSKKDKSILVVDDSNVISNYLKGIFDDAYNIEIAKDGDEAIAKLSDKSLNLKVMLLDLNLPTVNGYEVLNFMKVNNINDVNVAIVTGNDSHTVLEKVKGYRVGVIVEKPFNEASIKSAVEKLDVDR
jgi:CheY-like chemotaxis protein